VNFLGAMVIPIAVCISHCWNNNLLSDFKDILLAIMASPQYKG
jgi:hypothetical protein